MSAADTPLLVDLSSHPQAFFDLLPADWQTELLALWPDFAASSTVLGLQLHEQLIGGGIIFREPTPDTHAYLARAQSLFAQGLLYFGYLWITPDQRGHDYGGCWIRALRQSYPGQGFWLAIEDSGLRRFYAQHGFVVSNTLRMDDHTEWIMTDPASKPV